MTPSSQNISETHERAAPAFAERPFDAAMRRFLRAKRREGRPVKWIAAKLGIAESRALREAHRLNLINRSPRAPAPRAAGEPAPIGPLREIADEGLCRWLVGCPKSLWRMCAHPAVKGSAWCEHHRARVHPKRKAASPK